jgi:hypothetical protein
MAHQPMLRADYSPHLEPGAEESSSPTSGPEWVRDDSGGYLAEIAVQLASHGGGEPSADGSLDWLLHEVVEQARVATGASGVALALARDDEVVCWATTGDKAPDLGARLNTRFGVSGACIQSKEFQLCDDTETDPRVDAAASRELDVRSILAVPILDGETLLGVFEVLAQQPNAFGEGDIHALKALSHRIVDNLRPAAASPASTPEPDPPSVSAPDVSPAAAVSPVHDEDGNSHETRGVEPPRLIFEPEEPIPWIRRPENWTGVLMAIVIALALFLGWMIGRTGRQAVSVATPSKEKPVVPEPPSAPPSSAPKTRGSSAPARPEKKSLIPAEPNPSKKPGNELAEGGLVVYEKGKVIFRMTPPPQSSNSRERKPQPK